MALEKFEAIYEHVCLKQYDGLDIIQNGVYRLLWARSPCHCDKTRKLLDHFKRKQMLEADTKTLNALTIR